jgi:hypothetical protein
MTSAPGAATVCVARRARTDRVAAETCRTELGAKEPIS